MNENVAFGLMKGGIKQLEAKLKNEEFKMMEGEDDMVDLLNEKINSKNIQEFYQDDEIEDLK